MIRAMRSCTAVTLPWAMPLTLSPTRSTTPAIVPATTLAGPASGIRGCGWVGADFFASANASPRSASVVAAELVAHLREELALLFLDVVTHVLDEHGDLGVEALVRGVHVVELGQQPLDDVVLLEALEGDVLGVGNRRPGDRVEDLLLDRGVHRELLDDPVDDLALLDVARSPAFSKRLNSCSTVLWSSLRRVIASMARIYPLRRSSEPAPLSRRRVECGWGPCTTRDDDPSALGDLHLARYNQASRQVLGWFHQRVPALRVDGPSRCHWDRSLRRGLVRRAALGSQPPAPCRQASPVAADIAWSSSGPRPSSPPTWPATSSSGRTRRTSSCRRHSTTLVSGRVPATSTTPSTDRPASRGAVHSGGQFGRRVTATMRWCRSCRPRRSRRPQGGWQEHLGHLTCDPGAEPRPARRGGQRRADAALAALDVTGYAKRRSQVHPPTAGERRSCRRTSATG